MDGIMTVALIISIPIILFPAAFIWYLNIGGVVQAMREAKARQRKVATVPGTAK